VGLALHLKVFDSTSLNPCLIILQLLTKKSLEILSESCREAVI